MLHGLIDGDLVLFRAAFVAEEYTRLAIRNTMELILSDTSVDSYSTYLTGKDNFRKEIYPEYKADRKKKELPLEQLAEGKEYMMDIWEAEIVNGIEADDAIGLNSDIDNTIIITLDKDLDMIPGWHYNWIKQDRYFMPEEDAFRNFCLQCIQGDRTDNIPGLYKTMGQKATKKIMAPLYELDDPKEMFKYVQSVYGSRFQPNLHLIASLLWIQRGDARTYDQYINPPKEEDESEEQEARTCWSVPEQAGSEGC